MNKPFDYDWYIQRNKESAIRLYGDRLDDNRKVKGTNIWFDDYWRIHETEETKMTQLDKLILDFQAELDQNGFGDKSWEYDSYHYMANTVEHAYACDNTIPKDKIVQLLDDLSVSLQQAYFNILDFLGGIQNEQTH